MFAHGFEKIMLPIFAIPIVEKATMTSTGFFSEFISQRIDVILFDILIWFGWIPIFITMIWGFLQLWLAYRQGIYAKRLEFMVLAIDVPASTEQTPKALENFFALLYATKSAITFKEKWLYGKFGPVYAFEIVSTEGFIQFVIRIPTNLRDIVEAGIYAQYPDAGISEIEDYATYFPSEYPDEEYETWGAELTLSRPSMFPIRTYVDFEDRLTGEIKDPLGYTLEQLARMRPGEHFWIQILLQPESNDWIIPGIKFVNKAYGIEEKVSKGKLDVIMSPFVNLPAELIDHATGSDIRSMLSGAEVKSEADPFQAFKISPAQKNEIDAIIEKTSKTGHNCKIRILYTAKKNAFVKGQRAGMIKGILNQYTNLNLNKFKMYVPQIPKNDYFWQTWSYTKKQSSLMQAYQNRSWGVGANPFVLNVEEIATLWHFPAIGIKAPLIKKQEARKAEPPVGLPITHAEHTLPGFDIYQASEEDNVDLPFAQNVENLPSGDEVRSPLEESLPNIPSPTSSPDETKIPEDENIPSNLPI
jgi:hypothetical protein